MGSKSKIAKYIVPIIQDYIEKNRIVNYCEPFVGGANVIDKIQCLHKFGFDKNEYLIALLEHVKNGGKLYDIVDKDMYDKARKEYRENKLNEFNHWQIGCIGFLASYNGRFFDGGYAKTGIEKTKNRERIRNYYEESKNNLLKQSKIFTTDQILFEHHDYKNLVFKDYLIYCDPPYKNTKQYDNSKDFNHEQFWDIVRKWSKDNIVIVSELEAPDDFVCIWEQEVKRTIKAKDKQKVVEKLFMLNNNKIKKEIK